MNGAPPQENIYQWSDTNSIRLRNATAVSLTIQVYNYRVGHKQIGGYPKNLWSALPSLSIKIMTGSRAFSQEGTVAVCSLLTLRAGLSMMAGVFSPGFLELLSA
jgi:hypothetical protein